MKTKIFLSLFAILASFSFLCAQQLGRAYELTTDNNNTYQSGLYQRITSSFPDNSTQWKHLFVIRHNTTTSNYQFQLGSSYTVNDRMFFRKISEGTNISKDNAWHEVATRGTNTFTGNQKIIDGALDIGVNGENSTQNELISITHWKNPLSNTDTHGFIYYPRNFWFAPQGTHNSQGIHFNECGNIGIGRYADCENKLVVKGKILAQEVRVDINPNLWPDFVFTESYKLPELSEVKAHIDEFKHLPNIPSETEVKENGIGLAEMTTKLLQKVEELTLYAIQQQEKINELNTKIEKLENNKK